MTVPVWTPYVIFSSDIGARSMVPASFFLPSESRSPNGLRTLIGDSHRNRRARAGFELAQDPADDFGPLLAEERRHERVLRSENFVPVKARHEHLAPRPLDECLRVLLAEAHPDAERITLDADEIGRAHV